MTSLSHLLLDIETIAVSPMPVDAPPVGPARARALRLLQLRERLAGPVDADAVAASIARRALFTQQLTARLVSEAAAERSQAA
jgi:hypothetical protein